MSACPAILTGPGFLTSVLDHMDCQAQTIGAAGYQALGASGSPVSLALTGLLTLFIAIWGIRLLMGQLPDGGALIAIALKIGVVLMLASSWAAYRIVAYDLVLHAPAEIASSLGSAADLPASNGGLVARLQGVDDAMLGFTAIGTGRFDLAVNPASASQGGLPLGRTVISDDLAFGGARLAFLVTTIGMLSLFWLSAGLLLALAPLFAGLLLFEGTRGFFFGWMRALTATALGVLFLYVLLAIEIAMLEPWLANVLALRQARIATSAAPVELLVMTFAFTLFAVGSALLSGKIAFTLHIPIPLRERWQALSSAPYFVPSVSLQRSTDEASAISRAMLLSHSVTSMQRREALMDRQTPSVASFTARSAAGPASPAAHGGEGRASGNQAFHPLRRRISATRLERRQRP